MMRGGKGWLKEAGWVLFWALASSVWCAGAARELGATFDEPFYLRAGLEGWRSGSAGPLLNKGTMPLPVFVATAPLRVWERWRGRPFDAEADLDFLLPVARLGTLPFWWLLLGYGYVAGRRLGGAWGGRLAVAFLACEPNLLAHAGLATTDVAHCACLLALLVHFASGREGGWWRRVGLPAAWFAVALVAKASALVMGPLGMVVLELERRARGTGGGLRARLRAAVATLADRPFRRDLVRVLGLGLALTFLACGCDWRPSASFVRWARGLPEGRLGAGMVWLSEHLCVFSNAGNALARQVKHNLQGHGVFLLGRTAPRALWYYFPVALAIKLTVPMLALPLALAALSPRSLANWACLVAGALLLFSLNCRVQVGVRMMLPLIGLACVGLGAALADARRSCGPGWRRRVVSALAGLSLAWMGGSALGVWPHGLCYTNELWGGTRAGYLRLCDSNYDWGQGLKELARWQPGHAPAPLAVLYHGTDPAVRRPPFRRLAVEGLPARPEELAEQLHGGPLAVSTTLLYGPFAEHPKLGPLAEFLKARRPVARTTTFLIYEIPPAVGRPGG
jgi:hypothetical protein